MGVNQSGSDINHMKKILIVEDNSYAAEELKNIILTVDQSLKVFVCPNDKEARKVAEEEDIAVFIVDIMLEDGRKDDVSGLEFVDDIRKTNMYKYSPVIFITALSDPRLYAYEKLHCYQYMEKPFQVEEVKEMVRQALEMSDRYEKETYICLRDSNTIIEQKVSDIIYVECKGRKLTIVTVEGTCSLYYKTIADVKRNLMDHNLFQCNRSTLVNRKYIWKIDMDKGEIRLKNGNGVLTFGRVYKQRISQEYLAPNQ